MRRKFLIIVLVAAMLGLAGCTGMLSSANLSDHAVKVSDQNEPYILFNYSVEEEQSAVIESPGGTTISEHRISPERSTTALSFPTHQPGTYTLAIRSEGDTVTEKKIDFDGPNPEIVDVSPTWSENSLQSIEVEIKNSGDLPTPIEAASVEARHQEVSLNPAYEWLEPNETSVLEISTDYQSSISIDEPGDVNGNVFIETPNSTLQAQFQETFEGPEIGIQNVDANWEANRLDSIHVDLENTGDMAVEVNTSANRGGSTLGYSGPNLIPAGGSSSVEITSYSQMLSIDSPRTVSVEVIADSEYGYESTTIQKEIEAPSVEMVDISPNWDDDVLTGVDVEAKNSGDITSEATAIVKANGDEVYEGEVHVDGDSTETELVSPLFGDIGTLVGDGDMKISVSLTGEQGNGTASSTKNFGERKGDITNVETTFTSDYGENTSSLSSLKFTVRNTGDLPIRYDDVRFQVDGVSATDSPYLEEKIEVGSSKTVRSYPDMSLTDGSHELKIQLLNEEKVVVEESTTISTD